LANDSNWPSPVKKFICGSQTISTAIWQIRVWTDEERCVGHPGKCTSFAGTFYFSLAVFIYTIKGAEATRKNAPQSPKLFHSSLAVSTYTINLLQFLSQFTVLLYTIKYISSPQPSLHRHRLGQIAWLVNIGAARAGGVIRQQLQRHHVQHGRKFAVVFGHADHMQALGALHF